MVVINMNGVGQLVDEDTYDVTLTRVSEKKTRRGDDMITFQATISKDHPEFGGRSLFRNYVIPDMTLPHNAEKDMAAILYYLQLAFIAFEGDEDELTSESFNPVEYGKTLYGNRAQAKVTHVPDSRDESGAKMQASVEFAPSEM